MGSFSQGEIRRHDSHWRVETAGIVAVRLVGKHVPEIQAIAAQSFPIAWTCEDFQYFVDHSAAFATGRQLPSGELAAYLLALLVEDDLDVISIATLPCARRLGLAESLLTEACQDYRVNRILLEVDTSNEAGLGLYQKLGFQVSGVRRKYYAHKHDAYLMQWARF
jgi:[ribosomal protein S18]-alanine N-acetyltransferase